MPKFFNLSFIAKFFRRLGRFEFCSMFPKIFLVRFLKSLVSRYLNSVSDLSWPSNAYFGQLTGTLRACSHESGTMNYPGAMIAQGQALPRVHMMICCPGAMLPRVNFIAPGQVHRNLITTNLSEFL